MRVAFFGIYGIGGEALSRLLESGAHVVGVATKRDAQPVREIARRRGIPDLEADRPGFRRRLRDRSPDVLVVAGYHRILSPGLLSIPPRGAFNLHLSLLPAYRGPCPWKWAIARGERRTGVTVHRMVARADAGEIVAQEECPIDGSQTAEQLFGELSRRGARVLAETIRRLWAGPLEARPQDEAQASYFAPPGDADTRIDWGRSAERIRDQVRGFSPRPGAWASLDGVRIRMDRASPVPAGPLAEPGTILDCGPDWIRVATGTTPLDLTPSGAVHVRIGGRFDPA